MIYYEHRRGTITKVRLGEKTLEEYAKEVMGYGVSKWYDTVLQDLLYDEDTHILIDDILYKIDYEEIDPYSDIYYAKIKDLSTIEFEVRYYNGGCSMTEAITKAVKENIFK